MDNENIDKNEVDNSGKILRSGLLYDKYLPKAQNLQIIGNYLKEKYYPELSLDEINERVDTLIDKGLTLDKIVERIEAGKLDLKEMPQEVSLEDEKEQEDEQRV